MKRSDCFSSSGSVCVSLLLLNMRPLFKRTCPNLFHHHPPHTRTHARTHYTQRHTFTEESMGSDLFLWRVCLSYGRRRRKRGDNESSRWPPGEGQGYCRRSAGAFISKPAAQCHALVVFVNNLILLGNFCRV